jgi:uncharacterized membrane protein YdjX (TVP38/TMEM64 family)
VTPATAAALRRARAAALLLLLAAALLAGYRMRSDLGVEWSVESIRAAVRGFGLAAPLLFVALVAFRHFLFLPSMAVLTAAGLIFGGVLGTLLASLGILISALLYFAAARGLGREWLRPHLAGRLEEFERRIEGVGPLLIGLATAHPLGPMSPFHWGAGLSSLRASTFVGVMLLAAPVRAGAFAFFGANLADVGSEQFWLATALLLAAALLPLAHPGLRRRLISGLRAADSRAQ